ncbi:putative short-chain dehydrogenase [Xylaria sp. FL1777]|nr:putative short-chain dehydrogenase [Xylaria sp. FL1777]
MYGRYAKFTDKVYKNTYPAIDASRPELSQEGKTVLITGGHTGIGYGISRAFLRASAAKVIVLGRRKDVLATATKKLAAEAGAGAGEVVGVPCDITDAAAVDAVWAKLRDEGVVVDVLVLSVSVFAPKKPLLEVGTADVWKLYDTNVRAQLQLTERFYKQEGKGASATKNLIYISTVGIHDFIRIASDSLGYGLTKHASHLTMQLIAQETPPEKMQVISYHPGAVFTEAAAAAGWTEETLDWDNVDLPGHYAVWAASPEAKFLHGRYTWAAWDVEQLKHGELRKRIDEDPTFLRIGVNGLNE